MWPTVALRSTCVRILSTSSGLTRGKMEESAPLQKSSVSPGEAQQTRGWGECQRSPIKLCGAAIKPTVIWRSPDEDLTITLIRLLTGSKFSTWSSSYLEDAMTDRTVTAMSQDKLTRKSENQRLSIQKFNMNGNFPCTQISISAIERGHKINI